MLRSNNGTVLDYNFSCWLYLRWILMAGFLLVWVLTDSRQLRWNMTCRDITCCSCCYCCYCCSSNCSYGNIWKDCIRCWMLHWRYSINSRRLRDCHSATSMDGFHWESSLEQKFSSHQQVGFKQNDVSSHIPYFLGSVCAAYMEVLKHLYYTWHQSRKLFHKAFKF